MTDFNDAKNSYRTVIDNSIKFSGKGLDFFIASKADILKSIIRRFLPLKAKPSLLDIGCGHGFIHSHLSSDCEVTGVDVAGEVLELARTASPNIKYIHHDGETLPFESEIFDVAIAMCVMHHVHPESWESFLVEMRRILKKGGIAVIFEHNPYNPVTRYVVANNVLDKGVALLRKTQLEKLINRSGFSKLSSQYIFFTPFANAFFRRLDKALGWCPLGAQYYTIGIR